MTKALLCLPSVSYSVVKDRFVAAHPELRGRTTRVAGRSRGSARAAHKIYEAAAFRSCPLSNLVEIAGLEPAASGLQSRRSPS